MTPLKKPTPTRIILNNLFWGFILWLFGYVLGIIFFMIVPPAQIGYFITPLGLALMLWVLFKKIHREQFWGYFNVGISWTIIAVVLDYIFIVRLFNSVDYYKPDVYLYYALTLIIPIMVGWWKFRRAK